MLNVCHIFPIIKVSWQQRLQLFYELSFAANPLDKWFCFHCFNKHCTLTLFLFSVCKYTIFFGFEGDVVAVIFTLIVCAFFIVVDI